MRRTCVSNEALSTGVQMERKSNLPWGSVIPISQSQSRLRTRNVHFEQRKVEKERKRWVRTDVFSSAGNGRFAGGSCDVVFGF